MALKSKRANWVVLELIILAMLLVPKPMRVQSYRYCVQCGTAMVEDKTQVPATEVEKMGEKFSSLAVDLQDSARQIPTGPDPLHHNSNPIGP